MKITVTSRSRAASSIDAVPVAVWRVSHGRSGPKFRWVAWVPGQFRGTPIHPAVVVDAGWNGSYHDAHWDGPAVMAFGPTPAKAKRRLRRALAAGIAEVVRDASVARFEARRLVRPGD
jgi:hypothetical protein